MAVRLWHEFLELQFMGYDYLVMLVFVALQIIVEVSFLMETRMGRHLDIDRRVANVLAGMGCSIDILVFDFALQCAL